MEFPIEPITPKWDRILKELVLSAEYMTHKALADSPDWTPEKLLMFFKTIDIGGPAQTGLGRAVARLLTPRSVILFPSAGLLDSFFKEEGEFVDKLFGPDRALVLPCDEDARRAFNEAIFEHADLVVVFMCDYWWRHSGIPGKLADLAPKLKALINVR